MFAECNSQNLLSIRNSLESHFPEMLPYKSNNVSVYSCQLSLRSLSRSTDVLFQSLHGYRPVLLTCSHTVHQSTTITINSCNTITGNVLKGDSICLLLSLLLWVWLVGWQSGRPTHAIRAVRSRGVGTGRWWRRHRGALIRNNKGGLTGLTLYREACSLQGRWSQPSFRFTVSWRGQAYHSPLHKESSLFPKGTRLLVHWQTGR